MRPSEAIVVLWNAFGTFPDVRSDPTPLYQLSKPPLVQAFGQVRFSAWAKLATMEGLAPVQELLDLTFPYMSPQQVQQVALLVGPGGVVRGRKSGDAGLAL